MSVLEEIEKEISEIAQRVVGVVSRVRGLSYEERWALISRLRSGDHFAQLAADHFAKPPPADLFGGLVGLGRGVKRESSA